MLAIYGLPRRRASLIVMFVVQILDLSHPLPGLHAWLSSADDARPADLIFVLAGQMSRKDYALHLFRGGLAPRLLFSVGRFEIRSFSKMALPIQLDALARREYGSPIAHPHQQRDTPTAYQNVLPGSLAASCGRSTSCRPELFLGLCGPAKLCNSVHAQRPAGISKGLSLSGPANAAVPSPQVAFFKLSRACLLILLCGKVRTLLQR